MTNFEIIANEAILQGIFTQEEVEEYITNMQRLPLHTFAEWKSMGYSVKKGEHAKMKCSIWRYKESEKKSKEDGEKNEKKESSYYMKLSHFFTADQVEKIEKKEKVTR